MVDVERIVKSAIKSGSVHFGSKQAVEAARSGRAVALVLASNCPDDFWKEVQRHASLSKVPLYRYRGSSLDLGMACGKPFAVSALTVRQLTEPELLRTVRASRAEVAET